MGSIRERRRSGRRTLHPSKLRTRFEQRIEAKGHHETARRMRSLASRIFRYAVGASRAAGDPTIALRGLLAPPKVKHHSAIVDPHAVGQLLNAIDEFQGYPLTKLALQLTPHVFVRPGELRHAEWSEFDLKAAVWVIPANKMKMREPHAVRSHAKRSKCWIVQTR